MSVSNNFRHTYNHIRPHEALGDETPASRWKPSRRRFSERIAPPRYPAHLEQRRVSNAGCFRLHSGQQFLSQALNGETIALEQVDDAIWNILYYDTLLGRYDQRTRRLTGVPALRGKC
jgi:putative transposase